MPDNTVSMVVNSSALYGWTDVRITRRCEGLPNDFELSLTATDPNGLTTLAQANDPVTIKIGSDLVLTGYVDEDSNEAGPESHDLGLAGRGKTRDLVDCSAQWKGGLINASSILQLCQKLGEPYSIDAALAKGTTTPNIIPALALNYGETCAEIIGRVARNEQVLYYEGVDGNVILSQVGSVRAASGISYGQNVQRWSVRNSMAERYSDIYCAQFSTDPAYDQGDGSFNLFGHVPDANVRWPRTLIINTEGLGKEVADAKAHWEVARRAGRGTIVRATVDSWRDAAGVLWTPNTLLPVQGPGLRYRPPGASLASDAPVDLCLSEVTYRYSEDGGETADMVLMPPEAFSPEPIQLLPPVPDVTAIGAAPVATTF